MFPNLTHPFLGKLILFTCLLLLGTLPLVMAAPGDLIRVSVDSSGAEGNGYSYNPRISGNGRFVAFTSNAPNLVPDDTNTIYDSFLHDRDTQTTTRISLASNGTQADGDSVTNDISSDGRFVALLSFATNLVPDDTNGKSDIFVYDRQTAAFTRVSVDSSGTQADGDSYNASISTGANANGRFITFESEATNLVTGDTNGVYDVFVHDRQTGTTTRVSVDNSGAQGNDDSYSADISSDGRFVTFISDASNLVADDTNNAADIFVHDRQTGTTTRVSVDSNGTQGDKGTEFLPSISGNGRFVAFTSHATNLVPGDTNDRSDIFVHDRDTGTTTRISLDSSGSQSNGGSYRPSISNSSSDDGRFVTFTSEATNLVAGDTNGVFDIFVHDRATGATTRVSVSSSGTEGNGNSYNRPTISGNGRFITFFSESSNLVPNDTNNNGDVFVAEQTGSPTRIYLPILTHSSDRS